MRLSNSLNPRALPQCLHESYQTPFCYATIDIRTNINEATFCYRISSRKRSAYAVSWLTNNIQSHSYAPLREGQQTFSQTQHLFQENIKKVLSFVEGKKMPPSFSSQEGVSAVAVCVNSLVFPCMKDEERSESCCLSIIYRPRVTLSSLTTYYTKNLKQVTCV